MLEVIEGVVSVLWRYAPFPDDNLFKVYKEGLILCKTLVVKALERTPPFDAKNPVHMELASLSMEAHRCLEDYEKLKDIEQRIDQLCAQLWGMDEKELELILKEMEEV